jgi:predicted GNAT family acetyltransferase
MPDEAVVKNDSEHRFELHVDGKIAFLNYRQHPQEIVLVHTEVPPELEGHGIGGKLARAALDYARQQNLKVSAPCPFVAVYIQRHPEYSDLLRRDKSA